MKSVESVRDRLLDAARAAKDRGDWHTSYRLLREASEHDETLPSQALADLGLAAWWLGFTRETLAITEEAHRRFLAEGAVDHAAMNAVDLAVIWTMRGDTAIGLGWLGRARRLLEDRPECTATGLLLYADVSIALEMADLSAALTGAHQLQAIGDRLGDPTVSALGLLSEGLVRIQHGRLREGFSLLDEAMLPVVADRVLPEYAGSIYCSVIGICHDVADLRRARQWTEAAQRWCERFSSAAMFLGVCRMHRAQLLRAEGAWTEAEREAREVCHELAELNRGAVAEAHYELGELHRLRAEPADAERSYRRAVELGHTAQPGTALLLLARGDDDGAWHGIQAALAAAEASPFARARLLAAQVEIAIAAARVGAAEEAAAELEQIHLTYDSPGFRSWARHARGAVLLAQGRPEEAAALLSEACRLYVHNGELPATAAVRMLLAACHRATGRAELAAREEEAAELLLHDLGRPTDRPGRGSNGGPGGLTLREVEVLRHVIAGTSNREIGKSLSISEKTVGRHLSNIFAKLDVTTRTAAATWAHQHGITGVPAER